MDLYLLAELKTVALKITTVDMLKPPPDFRWNTLRISTQISITDHNDDISSCLANRSNFDSTPPPILIDAGVAVLENEKIER